MACFCGKSLSALVSVSAKTIFFFDPFYEARARSGEQDASKGSFVHIVPLAPAYKAGLAGRVPAKLSFLTLGQILKSDI